MRDVLRYLADCRYVWMWGLLSGIAYAAVFGLYGIRWEAIWYPLLLAAAFGLFFLILLLGLIVLEFAVSWKLASFSVRPVRTLMKKMIRNF